MNKTISKIILIIIISTILVLVSRTLDLRFFEPKKSEVDIQFLISPEYESYLVNQSIWLKFLIINKTNKRYQLKRPFDVLGIQIEIIGPDNVSVRKISVSEDALEMDSFYLIENDSAISIFNLDMYMHSSFVMEKKLSGVYKIKAYYQGIESNQLNIQVNYPVGDDKNLFDQTFGAFYPFSNNDQSKKLENLLNLYNISPYAPQLYEQLIAFTPDTKDTTRFNKIFEKYFDDFPNSYHAIEILDRYKVYLGNIIKLNKAQCDSRILEIRNKNKGQFIAKCIDNNSFANFRYLK